MRNEPETAPAQAPAPDIAPSAVPGEVAKTDDPDGGRVHPVMKGFGDILYWTGVVTALAIAALGLMTLAAVEDTGYAMVFLIAAAAVYGIGRFCLFFLAHD